MKKLLLVSFLLATMMLSYSVASAASVAAEPQFVIPALISKAVQDISSAFQKITGYAAVTGYEDYEGYEEAAERVTGYAASCYTFSDESSCMAAGCCWSGFWNFCANVGQRCCHDKAYGTEWYTTCPNDALDCYVCDPTSLNKNERGWVDICKDVTAYEACRGKSGGDSCGENKFCWYPTLYPEERRCKCVSCIESFSYVDVYGSLPGSVVQQGDYISGYVKSLYYECPQTPTVMVSVNEAGCVMDESFSAGRYYCSGSACGYEFIWYFPQLPAGCLGKTVTLTASSEGASTSKAVKFSTDATRDEPPRLSTSGTWSPAGMIVPADKVSYTASATDDKGLKEIQIYQSLPDTSTGWSLAKTCPVSGTSASCTHLGGTYSAGVRICYKGSAIDTKGQSVSANDIGAKSDCEEVCSLATDTDGKNYAANGTCTWPARYSSGSCDYSTGIDFCPFETPGNCCGVLGANWYAQNTSTNGSTTCCYMESKWGPCLRTQPLICKNILVEYSAISDKECGLEYYDCSKEGKTCQGGRCATAGTTTTTSSTTSSTTTTTICPSCSTSSTTTTSSTSSTTSSTTTTTTLPGAANFKVALYGDYNLYTEYSSVAIEGESVGKACYEKVCSQCVSWAEDLTKAIDTSKYCTDGLMEVSFSDSDRVNYGCNANHRACVYANSKWNCCNKECSTVGCTNSVVFNCNDWSCATGGSTTTTTLPSSGLSCGSCTSESSCSCSYSGTCNSGMWVVKNKVGEPLGAAIVRDMPPNTVTYEPEESGEVEVFAVCFDPLSVKKTSVTIS